MIDATDALAHAKIFEGLGKDALDRLAAIGEQEEHGLGTLVFAEGAPGDKLYVILDGRVRISRTVPGMGEEALAILGPGDCFGEMALIDEGPRSADARVHERCKLLAIRKEALDDLLFMDKELAYNILWKFVRTFSARLREMDDKLTFLGVTTKF